jgi:hypothetical protein
MMEAARTSETSVDNHFTRQYNPEDSSEHQLYFPSEGSFAVDFYRPWPGLNSRTLSPMGSTLTITPLRTTITMLNLLLTLWSIDSETID